MPESYGTKLVCVLFYSTMPPREMVGNVWSNGTYIHKYFLKSVPRDSKLFNLCSTEVTSFELEANEIS